MRWLLPVVPVCVPQLGTRMRRKVYMCIYVCVCVCVCRAAMDVACLGVYSSICRGARTRGKSYSKTANLGAKVWLLSQKVFCNTCAYTHSHAHTHTHTYTHTHIHTHTCAHTLTLKCTHTHTHTHTCMHTHTHTHACTCVQIRG